MNFLFSFAQDLPRQLPNTLFQHQVQTCLDILCYFLTCGFIGLYLYVFYYYLPFECGKNYKANVENGPNVIRDNSAEIRRLAGIGRESNDFAIRKELVYRERNMARLRKM